MSTDKQIQGSYAQNGAAVCWYLSEGINALPVDKSQDASVAQRLEHLPSKQNVAGSSPVACSKKLMAQRLQSAEPSFLSILRNLFSPVYERQGFGRPVADVNPAPSTDSAVRLSDSEQNAKLQNTSANEERGSIGAGGL